MLDAPLDAWPVLVALSIASVAVTGVAASLAAPPAPDAAAAANTVDSVAASPYPATGRHPLTADRVRLAPRSLSLRGPGGTSHATLSFPVVPTAPGTPLCAVARGAPPTGAFPSLAAFREAVDRAASGSTAWHAAADSLVVRHVTREGVDATLACA